MSSRETRASGGPRSGRHLGAHVTDEDIERYLSQAGEERSGGFWNLSTAAGATLIAVGVAYLFQQGGMWDGLALGLLVNVLPWLAAVLIILIGCGLISRESRSRDTSRSEAGVQDPASTAAAGTSARTSTSSSAPRSQTPMGNLSIGQAAKNFFRAVRQTAREKRLIRSTDRKIAGVCGGLADYFGIDPTLVRIGFVIVTVLGSGAPILIYLGLLIAMPGPHDSIDESTRVSVTGG